MTESKHILPPVDKAVGNILGTIRCLLMLEDVDNYEEWVVAYHGTAITSSHFPGYKLLFDTLLRMLASEIEDNISLELSEDDIFPRAKFRGVEISKLPNTCEKTVLLKNIFDHANNVIETNDWHNFRNTMLDFSNAVLHPLFRILNVSEINPEYSIENIQTAINYAAIFQAYIFLNDTSRGRPHGYTSAMLDDGITLFNYSRQIGASLRNAFPGYKLGVQYLWSRLLPDRFSKSILGNLHQANNWDSFDKYFEYIQKEIINPIEQRTRARLGFDYAILITESPKRFLRDLLERKPPRVEVSERDNLYRAFLWYPIRLVDSSDFSFAGVPALIPLLMGMIQIKRRRKEKSRIKLIRLIHGKPDEHRRDYSYAVLVELGGIISDASGWMLFYDCCSDRGSTSGLYRSTEQILNRYENRNFIEVTELWVNKRDFLNLMEGEIISGSFSANDNP